MTPPCVLSAAGSDSGAGAGIQADLKTMTLLGAYGTSVITAVTAQNGLGVKGIYPVTPEFVRLQFEAVKEAFPLAAGKIGMSFSSKIIITLAECFANRDFPLVVDPVCVSQSGHRLLQEEAVKSLCEYLLPLADIITPNRPEAELLAAMPINGAKDMEKAGKRLLAMGCKAVLIKGGHFCVTDNNIRDWLFLPNSDPKILQQRWIDTKNNHGTGCTLSAAIATFLGFGHNIEEAVKKAQAYLNKCLAAAYAPGKGFGPVNHVAGAQIFSEN